MAVNEPDRRLDGRSYPVARTRDCDVVDEEREAEVLAKGYDIGAQVALSQSSDGILPPRHQLSARPASASASTKCAAVFQRAVASLARH